MQLRQDTELQNGKYRIVRVLGQGGFGITYLAENVILGRKVAIKEFFPKEFCGRDNTSSHLTIGTEYNRPTVEKLKVRFLKEARNIAKLDHPGIVKVFDIFEENDTAYYVMEYIHGENLHKIVKLVGRLPEDKAIKYISEVGSALEYVHSRNMTHFDVKPANIVVRQIDNCPILIDFGLSKQYDNKGDATSSMLQAVSHGYSPIELYNANTVLEFSPKTDVYSLAASLYFLLTGNVPPHYTEILEEGFPSATGITPSVMNAIKHGMAVTKVGRPESINDFVKEITIHSNPVVSQVKDNNLGMQQRMCLSNEDESTQSLNIQDEDIPTKTRHNVSNKDNKLTIGDKTLVNAPHNVLIRENEPPYDEHKPLFSNIAKIIMTILAMIFAFIIALVFFNGCQGVGGSDTTEWIADTCVSEPDYEDDVNYYSYEATEEATEQYEAPATEERSRNYVPEEEALATAEDLTPIVTNKYAYVKLNSIIDAFARKVDKSGFSTWSCLTGLGLDSYSNKSKSEDGDYAMYYGAALTNNYNQVLNGYWYVVLTGPVSGVNLLTFFSGKIEGNLVEEAKKIANAVNGKYIRDVHIGYFLIKVYQVKDLLFAICCNYESNTQNSLIAYLGNQYYINRLLDR